MRARANDPRFKGLTEQQRRERIEFVAGNVLFAMAHEVGHMLISELGLPVLGREEDAADTFAVMNLLNMNYAFSNRVLTQSARGWFLSDRRNAKENIPMAFYDEHALDKQRAYNIVCLMVGSNPENFRELATTTKMPEERQRTCRADYNNASWSWKEALAPHMRKPDQPKTTIEVNYAKSEKYPIFARGFRHILMLEEIAERLSDRFIFRQPIRPGDERVRRTGRALGSVDPEGHHLLRTVHRLRAALYPLRRSRNSPRRRRPGRSARLAVRELELRAGRYHQPAKAHRGRGQYPNFTSAFAARATWRDLLLASSRSKMTRSGHRPSA